MISHSLTQAFQYQECWSTGFFWTCVARGQRKKQQPRLGAMWPQEGGPYWNCETPKNSWVLINKPQHELQIPGTNQENPLSVLSRCMFQGLGWGPTDTNPSVAIPFQLPSSIVFLRILMQAHRQKLITMFHPKTLFFFYWKSIKIANVYLEPGDIKIANKHWRHMSKS